MQDNAHQISKLVMKMHVPAQEGAYALQNKASALLKGKMLARIEQVLSEFNIPGKTIRIPKIDIDLTDIPMNDVNDDMVVHVEEKLRHYLQRLLHDNLHEEHNAVTIVTHAQSDLDLIRFILMYGCLPWWAHTQRDAPLSIAAIFKKIFDHGNNYGNGTANNNSYNTGIPGNNSGGSYGGSNGNYGAGITGANAGSSNGGYGPGSAGANAGSGYGGYSGSTGANAGSGNSRYAGSSASQDAGLSIQALYASLKSILHLPQVHERLVRYLTGAQLQAFTNHVLAQHAEIRKYAWPMLSINVNRHTIHALILKTLHPGHALTTQLWLGYMVQVLAMAGSGKAGMFKAGMYNTTVLRTAAYEAGLLKGGKNNTALFNTGALKAYLSRIMAKDTLVAAVLKAVAQTHVLTEAQKTQLLLPFAGQHASIKTPADVSRLLQASQKDAANNAAKQAKESPHENAAIAQDEGVYIEQAGLVLVHPYLVPLFNGLGLLEKNNFRDDHARHYAVHVLHYLASGKDSHAEEHELVLHKLLCGLEPEAPLDLNHQVSEEHQQECENLLQAVIDNWGALKRSTPGALRKSFFERSGCLRRQNNGWTLNIERTGFDVLLDKLPWGISIIKTPWYNEFIFVEW